MAKLFNNPWSDWLAGIVLAIIIFLGGSEAYRLFNDTVQSVQPP